MKSTKISFTVPATEDDVFLLKMFDDTLYEINILDVHVASGQKLSATLENGVIMLPYFHSEGEFHDTVGTNSALAIGRLLRGGADGALNIVIAEMDKYVYFNVPTAKFCIVQLDDGRQFEVRIPEYLTHGQELLVFIGSDCMLLENFSTEAVAGTALDELGATQLCIGRETEPTRDPDILAVTYPCRLPQKQQLHPNIRVLLTNDTAHHGTTRSPVALAKAH